MRNRLVAFPALLPFLARRTLSVALVASTMLAACTGDAPRAETQTLAAQGDQVDALIRDEMRRQKIPGLSLAVLRDGRIIKAAGYGLADIERRIPATPETVYKIGSVSKQFIATGIMLLVREGRLRLDDPIGKHIAGTPEIWKGITIRHLLTHTSGLVREAPGYDRWLAQSDSEVIATAYELPLQFGPGGNGVYSNLGYFVLADVIRRVSGRPWTEYLDENVFKPSGMNTTYPTNTQAILPNRARGYTGKDEPREERESVALRPSGAFLSTVLDMARWDAMLYTDSILSDSIRRQMWTPVTLNDGSSRPYGFGWSLEPLNGRRAVYHNGGMPGASAKLVRFVDDRLTIIVLMNLDDVDREAIIDRVAKHYLAAR